MKKKIIIILLVLLTVFIKCFFIYYDYNKLNNLYEKPIKVNQKYDDYTYDEYKNHVTILTYDGESEYVVIPKYINKKEVYSIDDSAFYGNPKLVKVVIPDSVIRIGHQTFIGCNNLVEVKLPDNILDIGPYSFDVCSKLKSIYVKKNSKTDKVLKDTKFYKYISYK